MDLELVRGANSPKGGLTRHPNVLSPLGHKVEERNLASHNKIARSSSGRRKKIKPCHLWANNVSASRSLIPWRYCTRYSIPEFDT